MSAPAAPAAPAAPTDQPEAAPTVAQGSPWSSLPKVQIHGFVSEGGYVSTANDYIGDSDRGSLKFFEGGINFAAELTDQLRVGLQFVSRSVGVLSEEVPRLDWAVIDYRYRPFIGLRAGVIKMPFGLYNEYVAVDSARTAILMPQSVYPLRNRDVLISHTGFALYGSASLGPVGSLDYQAWLGKLSIPRSALDLTDADLDSVDARYVAGGQLFWRPPIEGLRVGGTYLRTSIDFNISLDDSLSSQLVMAGLVDANYDGKLLISQRPVTLWVASAEYTLDDWLFAAEYSRWQTKQQSSIDVPGLAFDDDKERFYGMVTRRLSSYFELGLYYSVSYQDIDNRRGSGASYAKPYMAWQKDLAGTLRLDVNEYWLWKLEAHFIDGVADLLPASNPDPTRYWGLFLLRTTVTF